MFFTVEGMDNVGKSTVCERVATILRKDGFNVLRVSDPPAIEPWKSLKGTLEGDKRLSTPSRLTLYLAARLDACERVIKPGLSKGSTILADRYYDSWFAYQVMSLEKSLGRENAFSMLESVQKCYQSRGMLVDPDKTYLIIDDPEVAAKRGRGKRASVYDAVEKQRRVQETFLWLAKKAGRSRIEIINNEGKSVETAADEVYRRIKGELSKR